MCSPVSAGGFVPELNSRFNVPLGLVVLLPVGSAIQRKFCDTAALVPPLNEEAVCSDTCEFLPPVAVAVPVAGRLNVPRIVPLPFTSRVLIGVLVFTPIFAELPVPDWNRTEFPSVLPSGVHSGTKLTVPLPARAGAAGPEEDD